jgi:hypothetical protein
MAATVRQLTFINSLIAERNVSDTLKTQVFEICRRPDASPAMGGPISQIIDQLKALPRAAGGSAAARPAGGRLADIPCARYVLERNEVALPGQTPFRGNDRIFIEVREFKGTRYMRKLVGAPGSYSREKLSYSEVDHMAAALREVTPLAATQRYGELYSVCSVCGAELTDDRSVELKLGPVCRGRFGF